MKQKLLLMALCTVFFSAINISYAADVKREVTSTYLSNTDFNDNLTGWTNDGFWIATHTKYSGNFAEMYSNSSTRAGSIRQTASNLPSGSYQMTAKCVGGTNEGSGYDYLFSITTSGTTKADVEWLSGDLAEERTLNFTVPTTQNVVIGFAANTTKWWSAIDEVKLYAMDLAAASYDLPNTAVTADTWYKFTTGSSSDAYILSSSNNATITYTTDGTITDDSGISTTWGLTAKQNVLLAPSTTYYIKSDAAVTLTKTESSVSSSCVTGWTKVTSLSELQTNPEDYFFAIYSANNTGLMVETKSSGVPYYLTATSPSSTYYLYEIGNYTYNAESYFVMKSCGTSGYFHPVSNNAYDLQAPSSKSVADDACRLTFEVANNGIWNIKTWAVYDSGNYLGLWTPSNGYVNGQNMAGNKTDAAKGSFLIYRIAKSNINLTGNITNPGFENATWSTGWTGIGTDKAQAFVKQSGNGSFSGNFAEMWVRNTTMSAGNIYQPLSKLPAGVYTLSAKVQAGIPSKLYARIDAEEQYIECNSSAKIETLTFLVSETSDVTIGLKHDGVSASGDVWVAVDDFALTYVEPLADSDDYDALNLAIEAANAKTLGFEVGEYAPYNNVDAISKLASAKAINQSAVNAKSTITSATTALASATWTANDGKVNAVYNGDFSNSEVGNYATEKAVTGWDKVGGMRQVVTSTVEGSPLYNKHGIYVWGSNMVTYGNTLGYTMPLGANKIYRASYRRMSWSGGTNEHGEITIKNSKNETVASFGTVTTTGARNYAGDYNVADASSVTEAIYFVTGEEADTYTATLCPWGNAVFTDVELISVDALPLSESSTVYYAAGIYPSVTLPRELSTTNWNTLCLPFATPVSDYAAVRELTDIDVVGDHVSITFTDVAETLVAGKPYLVKGNKGDTSISATNVAVLTTPASAPSVTKDDATVTYNGIFAPIAAIPQKAGNYVVSSNNLHLVDSEVSLKGYRGYFNVSVPAPVKSLALNFDDADVIKALEAAENEKPVIYNLAGQRLSKAQKGVNIINGKKVLVK